MRAGPQSTLSVMTFPLDPNAPGSPRRSEFVRQSFANAAELAAGAAEPKPQVSLWMSSTQWISSGFSSTAGMSRLTTTGS